MTHSHLPNLWLRGQFHNQPQDGLHEVLRGALLLHDVEPGDLDEHLPEESVTEREERVDDADHLVDVGGVGREVAPAQVEEGRLADGEDVVLGGRVGKVAGVVAPRVTEDVPVSVVLLQVTK